MKTTVPIGNDALVLLKDGVVYLHLMVRYDDVESTVYLSDLEAVELATQLLLYVARRRKAWKDRQYDG